MGTAGSFELFQCEGSKKGGIRFRRVAKIGPCKSQKERIVIEKNTNTATQCINLHTGFLRKVHVKMVVNCIRHQAENNLTLRFQFLTFCDF